ncbi:MAG: DivIVA domain-containing protein [Acidimicrobiia bacterium]
MSRNISSGDLRNVSFPTAKSGYDSEKVDAVIEICASTIEDLENQVAQLQNAVAMARAEAAPMELANVHDDEDVIAQWLTTLDPLEIDREVQKNIAEAIVESTMAASHIRTEARERVKSLIDAVAVEVQKLVKLVKQSRSSVAAANQLPNELAQWQGTFATKIGKLLQELQLPWTVQVSQLAKVLAHMAENVNEIETPEKPKTPPLIKRRQTNIDDGESTSATTKGHWS